MYGEDRWRRRSSWTAGGVHVEVGAQARHGAECGVSGMTIESLYAFIQAGQTGDSAMPLDSEWKRVNYHADSNDVKKSVKHCQYTQKDTREKLVFFFEEKLNAMERRSECGIRVFGVKENKVEDSRTILAKDVLVRPILGGIVTLEQALASTEHSHRIGPIGTMVRPPDQRIERLLRQLCLDH